MPPPSQRTLLPETITLLGLLTPFLLTLTYGTREDFVGVLLFALLPTLLSQTLPLLLWLRCVRDWPQSFRLPAPLLAVLANNVLLLATDFTADALSGLIFIGAPLLLILPTLLLVLGSHCAHHAFAQKHSSGNSSK